MIYQAIECFLTGLTAVSVLLCLWKFRNVRIAVTLTVVMTGCYISSLSGDFLLMGVVLFFGAALCVVRFRRWGVEMIDIEDNELAYAIAFILMLRSPFVVLYSTGIIGLSWLWLSSVVFLLLENLLIIKGYANGRSGRVNDSITDFRIRADEFIFSRRRV